MAKRLEAFRQRPLPKRASPTAKLAALQAIQDLLVALPERELYWKNLPKKEQDLSGRVSDAELAFNSLREALKISFPYINFPPSSVTKPAKQPTMLSLGQALGIARPYEKFPQTTILPRRKKKDWEIHAYHIAVLAIEIQPEDKQPISLDRNGPFIKVVTKALIRLGVETAPGSGVNQATLASALKLMLLRSKKASQ